MMNVGKRVYFSQTLLAEEVRKSSLPDEGICTSYHIMRKATKGLGAAMQQRPLYCVAPRSKSEADHVVSEMLAVFEYVDMFPAHYKKRLGQQLHYNEKGGSEGFLKEWVAAHSTPRSK